jgi:hypothetical protein
MAQHKPLTTQLYTQHIESLTSDNFGLPADRAHVDLLIEQGRGAK